MKKSFFYLCTAATLCFASCTEKEPIPEPQKPTELGEEWYSGGQLGTSFNSTSSAFEQSTPAVDENEQFAAQFMLGEAFFEDAFVVRSEEPDAERQGLGPLYIRNSCIACHPGYGHGQRQDRYRATDFGNGYLLVITDQNDQYLSSLTGMPQTKAVKPFKAPLNEDKISIVWKHHVDEWGNQFPDGEKYDLTYPEVTIPEDAYYVPIQVMRNGKPVTIPHSEVKVRLESTIGIYGTGLLDAISDDDLLAQYQAAEKAGVNINPAIYANGDWNRNNLYTNKSDSKKRGFPRRYTYALSRGPLQDAPGTNALWNITNVTREDHPVHYMTEAYAVTASQDPDVQKDFYKYFPAYNTGNIEKDIHDYLMGTSLKGKDRAELSAEDYLNFMVWHRGLAVPAARYLDDPEVQRGKKVFNDIGCTHCHRPSWTTGEDVIRDPNNGYLEGKALPRYPHQKIWPYTDMMQHQLHMVNDIRTGWCRTTPMWGRGLSKKCTGRGERLHDCRALTVIEAIMWHGSEQSDARESTLKFRELSKADRDAVVKFIDAI